MSKQVRFQADEDLEVGPLEGHTPMREFLNPPCRFCRIARISGLSIGLLAVLFLLVGFIITR